MLITPRFWSFRTFAALWCILLTPLAPTLADVRDPAANLPADSLAYIGWSHLVNDGASNLVKATAGMLRRFQVDEEAVSRITRIAETLIAIGGGSGGIALRKPSISDDRASVTIEFLIYADPETVAPALDEFIESANLNGAVHTIDINGMAALHGQVRIDIVSPDDHNGPTSLGKLSSGQPLAANSNFQRLRAKVCATSEARRMFSVYVNVPATIDAAVALSEKAGQPMPDGINGFLEELGINAISAAYLHAEESDDGWTTNAFLQTKGERKGLLSIWNQQPLTDEDLVFIPRDASWAIASNWDPAQTWEEALRVIEDLNPDAVQSIQAAIGSVSTMVGFSPTDDFLPALGDTWVFYDSPDNGGLWLSGTVLIAEVRDAAALKGAFARLHEIVAPLLAQQDITVDLRHAEYRGNTISYLVVSGLPVAIAPAAAFVGDRVICAMTPQPIKLAIDQADPDLRTTSILDQPDVQRLHDKFPARMQRFGYSDSRSVARSVYPLGHLVRTAATSLCAAETAIADPADLPTLPEVLAQTHCAVSVCSADDDGVLYKCYGNVFDLNAPTAQIGAVALLTSILLPSLARARELAKRAVSMSNLRGIGQSMHIYANDHGGAFPKDFDELIRSGFITREMLNSPRDRAGETSYVYVGGQSESSNTRNVVAYERPINDEGTNVLFLDGHVEWMTIDAFKQALRGTYQRLGRESEMPAELQP